jgi:hypothetical protein
MLINIQEGYAGSPYEACFISGDSSECWLGQRRDVQYSERQVQHNRVDEGNMTSAQKRYFSNFDDIYEDIEIKQLGIDIIKSCIISC